MPLQTTRALARLGVVLAFALPVVRAQDDPVPGRIDFEDDALPQEEFRFNDALRFKAWVEDGSLVCEVEMREPIPDSMFTCLGLYLDTDNNPATGLDGAEVWVRGAVGSRFHPNSFRHAEGKALDLLHSSFSEVVEVAVPGGEPAKMWRHDWTALPDPVVDGPRLRVTFPVRDIRAKGARYGSVAGIRAIVETSSSEQPITVETLCADDGLPIAVDGDTQEWSHSRLVRDPQGELHAAANFLDLTMLRVEHDATHLFAHVALAERGLEDGVRDNGMDRRDAVHVFVQPLHPRYQDPVLLRVPFGSKELSGTAGRERLAWTAVVRGDTIELGVERRAGQTLFRVVAWSDLQRFDTLGLGGFLPIDWSKQP